MIEDQNLTIAGTIGGEPDLKFTPSGSAVVNFSVAVNHRFFNKNTQQWEEKGTDWWRVNCWRQQAENVAESFKKGDRVIVFGKVASRQYETREGGKVTTWEITAEECAHSVKFNTTTQNRADRRQQAPRDDQSQYGGRGGPQAPARADDRNAYAPQDDPWGSPPPQTTNYGQSGGFADEPPF